MQLKPSIRQSQGKKDTTEEHRKAQSALDKAAKKHVMHKNKVARKKRQLSRAAKVAGSSTVKTTAKKAATKKPSKTTKPKKS